MDGEALWEKILKELSGGGTEVQTKRGLWFRASTRDQRVRVDNAAGRLPSTRMTQPRTILKKDFLEVFPYYPRWLANEKGIAQIVNENSHNSAYILALIKRFR